MDAKPRNGRTQAGFRRQRQRSTSKFNIQQGGPRANTARAEVEIGAGHRQGSDLKFRVRPGTLAGKDGLTRSILVD